MLFSWFIIFNEILQEIQNSQTFAQVSSSTVSMKLTFRLVSLYISIVQVDKFKLIFCITNWVDVGFSVILSFFSAICVKKDFSGKFVEASDGHRPKDQNANRFYSTIDVYLFAKTISISNLYLFLIGKSLNKKRRIVSMQHNTQKEITKPYYERARTRLKITINENAQAQFVDV